MSTKRKLDVKVAKPAIKSSAKPSERQRVNDARAVVTSGGGGLVTGQQEVVEISSGEEQEDESEEEISSEDEENLDDISMRDAEENEAADDLEQPSFGELVRINAAEPIDVAGAFDDPSSNAIKKSNGNQIVQSRLGASLGTVLTQALKTNDQSLLEQCLQETDLQTVRLTLQRLASPLASSLLHHLASRLHRKPGRAGSLIVWVQWSLVTHGGYLATQPALNKEIEELHRVLDERGRGLPGLLVLKGKLDMLEAQLKLRKSMQNQYRNIDDEDDEEAVVYVEGEESDDEDENDEDVGNGEVAANGIMDISDAESEISEDMPNTNGIVADSEADSEEDDSEDGGLVDDEAEETDADSGDEEETDFEDQDEVEEEEDSDDEKDAAPPSKVQKVSSMFSRKR